MSEKKIPFTEAEIREIIKTYPTPFHIYDERAIVDNARKFLAAFAWAPGFKEYFAVKATPNPHILKLLQAEGIGADCSSMAELLLCEKIGISGEEIIFRPTTHRMKSLPRPWKWALSSIWTILR